MRGFAKILRLGYFKQARAMSDGALFVFCEDKAGFPRDII